MKKFFSLFVVCSLLLATNVYATDNDEVVLAETTKYYKTITHYNDSSVTYASRMNNSFDHNTSITYEVTEEEYNNSDSLNNTMDVTVETTYKKMVSSIIYNNGLYDYKVKLTWKKMPKVRSYDIIGIGFPASVKAVGSPMFDNVYCTSSTNCSTSTSVPYFYKGTNGVGVTFQVPASSSYVSMNQTLRWSIEKNTSSVIVRQLAVGDYSHATKTVSFTNAKKYTVDTTGIVLDGSIYTSYDDIPTSEAEWTGRW